MGKGFYVQGVSDTKLECAISRAQTEKVSKKIRQKMHFKKGAFLSKVSFEFQLYRGDGEFPSKKTMTCSEAGIENRKLVKQYISSMDKGEERQLWSWKIVDIERFNSERQKFFMDNL